MRDYRQNPPTAEDINTHLLFTVGPPTQLRKIQKNMDDTYNSREHLFNEKYMFKFRNPPHQPYLCQFFIKLDVVTCIGFL